MAHPCEIIWGGSTYKGGWHAATKDSAVTGAGASEPPPHGGLEGVGQGVRACRRHQCWGPPKCSVHPFLQADGAAGQHSEKLTRSERRTGQPPPATGRQMWEERGSGGRRAGGSIGAPTEQACLTSMGPLHRWEHGVSDSLFSF